jgi:hypothetical protein
MKKHIINAVSGFLSLVVVLGTLAFAAPAKADGRDVVKVLGALLIMNELFNNNNNNNRNDNRNYDDRYYNGQQQGSGGYYNGQVYDDRGVYNRTCNDNLGCAPRDNNAWNEPRKYGYAQGRNGNGAPNGQVCGTRTEHYNGYTEQLHLDCAGNVMYVTRHRK